MAAQVRQLPVTDPPPTPTVLPDGLGVYRAILGVMSDLESQGITKAHTAQGYKFRGIDDVYNVLCGLLVKNQLVILPRLQSRDQLERQTKSGGALYFTTVTVDYDFVSVEDGSRATAGTCGEAMDSSDKSSNKAMSAAYKYMAFQAFCIPTEADNDADASRPIAAPTERPDPDAANEAKAINHLRSCAVDGPTFKAAWGTNGPAWKAALTPAAYARVVAEMKRLGEAFKAPPAPPPSANGNAAFPIDDEIPF